jgi:hypothetical protein
MFGHWATNCNDDETFWWSLKAGLGFLGDTGIQAA